ncbi:MAG: radical SAM protein [Candidatus Omnitrophica bacterium]|nr:radical SAM protein [Candidatus Omnitrophota bacterium]
MAENRRNYIETIHIEITRSCNLKCKYCFLEKDNIELDKQIYLCLLDELTNLGTLTITLTGGEPLIRKDIFYLIQKARKKGFKVGLLTNGTLIDKSTAHRLFKHGVFDFKVTLYGANEETYENFTGKRKFKNALKGIENLLNIGANIGLIYPINTLTYKGIPEIKKIYNKLKKNRKNINLKFSSTIAPTRRFSLKTLEYELPPDGLITLVNRWKIKLYKLDRSHLIRFKNNPIPCGAGITRCYISAEGRVFPCAVYYKEAGNIQKQSLTDIWYNSPLFTRLRELKFSDFKDCQTCYYRNICIFKCPAVFEFYSGNPTKCPDKIFSKAKRLTNLLAKGG